MYKKKYFTYDYKKIINMNIITTYVGSIIQFTSFFNPMNIFSSTNKKN